MCPCVCVFFFLMSSVLDASLFIPSLSVYCCLFFCLSFFFFFFCLLQALLGRVPWSEGCALCGRDDSPDKTLICDRCDREIHMFCLEPKLKKVLLYDAVVVLLPVVPFAGHTRPVGRESSCLFLFSFCAPRVTRKPLVRRVCMLLVVIVVLV